MTINPQLRTLLVLASLAIAAGCSEKTVSAPAAPPAAASEVAAQPAEQAQKAAAKPPTTADKVDAMLMTAVYGDKYRPATGDALAELPDPDNKSETGTYVITPVANTVLPTGETVLVANAEMAGDDGTAISSHAAGGLLNVYLMRQTDGKWNIIKRHENVTSLGSHGQLGSVEWVNIASGKPGLAIANGGTWQGYTVQSLALFDLTADIMRDLTGPGISIHSDSDGGCDEEGNGSCWSVTGKWRLEASKSGAVYDDVVLDFLGKSTTRAEAKKGQPAPARVAKKIAGTARYAYDGKQYKLVEGANLVPEA